MPKPEKPNRDRREESKAVGLFHSLGGGGGKIKFGKKSCNDFTISD